MNRVERLAAIVTTVLLAGTAAFLWHVVAQSAEMYGLGIKIAETAFNDRAADPVAMTSRIFVLTTAHEVVTFKAASLFLSAILTSLGSLFVLSRVSVAYDASVAGSELTASLKTTSPGLVMISLGCLLIVVTITSKVSVQDGTTHAVPAKHEPAQPSASDYANQARRFMEEARRAGEKAPSQPAPQDFAKQAEEFRKEAKGE
jgi:hypothetical protein